MMCLMIMHIYYIYTHKFFFNNYYFKSRHHVILLIVYSSSSRIWAALLKLENLLKTNLYRCFLLRKEMTTTKKTEIGLVPFRDVCTLLHRIKTYHRKEGGKAKKHIAREYLDKFFENHYPRFFNGGERKNAFRLYRLLAPQVRLHIVLSFSLFLVLLLFSLSHLANNTKVGPDERDEIHSPSLT